MWVGVSDPVTDLTPDGVEVPVGVALGLPEGPMVREGVKEGESVRVGVE